MIQIAVARLNDDFSHDLPVKMLTIADFLAVEVKPDSGFTNRKVGKGAINPQDVWPATTATRRPTLADVLPDGVTPQNLQRKQPNKRC